MCFTSKNCTRVGKGDNAPLSVTYKAYPQDSHLCVANALNENVFRTESWRVRNEYSQLLLSFIKPHNPVSSSNISDWLKNLLLQSGVDTSRLI